MIWVVAAAWLGAAAALSNESDYRLSSEFRPLEYRLSVVPDPEGGVFSAALSLVFLPLVDCSCLLLNSHLLRYDYSSLRLFDPSADSHVVLDRLVLDERLQRLALFPARPFKKGVSYELRVSYNGTMGDDGLGLYRAQYTDQLGVLRWMSVTQLRPVYARRLFPCFDEPSFKAHFQLRIWHDTDDYVLSNTQAIDTQRDGGYAVTTFEKTPLIPTFLVAFFVSRFAYVSTGSFSSFAVPGKEAGVAYSASVGPQMAAAMEHLLDIPYPLPKTDQVALPFLVPVAMENWALYNFREGNILYFPGRDKTVQKQTAARFSGHEITHAWMGNAVTLRWWDYLWLSEAFAMYYEYFLPGVVEPSWSMMEQMVVDLTHLGLTMDSDISSPPLTTTLLTPDEIAAKFSGITYFKGPSLIRMVSHVLSQKRYVNGFSTFLKDNWFGNVEPKQLWDTLERVSDRRLPGPLSGIMTTWTDQPGYPVVTAVRDYTSDVLFLSQSRFLIDDEEPAGNSTWWIPISLTSKHNANFECTLPKVWFKPQPTQKTKVFANEDDWILLNVQASGFYRVNYDERNWRSLITQLYTYPSVIHVLSRAALIDDSLALARAGQLAHAVALDLTKYLANEDQYIPWASALKPSSLPFYNDILMGSYLYEHYRMYMVSMLDEIYNTLGFEGRSTDSHLEKLTRDLIVSWACRLGNGDCVSRSKGYLRALMRGVQVPISVDVVDTALCTAVSEGTDKEWLFILSLYDKAPIDDKPKYLRALACTKDNKLINMFLGHSIGELGAADWGARFSAFAATSENAEKLLDILVNHQTNIDNRFGSATFKTYVDMISNLLQTPDHLRQVELLGKLGADISSATSAISKRIRWLEKYGNQLRDYFVQSALAYQ